MDSSLENIFRGFQLLEDGKLLKIWNTCSGPPEVPEAPRRETRPPLEASPGESFSDSPVEMLPEQPESPAIDSESE